MSQISSTVTPVVAQTFDGDMIMLCSYLYVFKGTYKHISKTKAIEAATSITKENTKT